jgi:hypothetical protein
LDACCCPPLPDIPVPEPAAELDGDVLVLPVFALFIALVLPLPAEPSVLLLLADEFAPVPSPEDEPDDALGELMLPPAEPVVAVEPELPPVDMLA